MHTFVVDQLVGQIVGGDDYLVERFLGKGRLQAVYLARQISTQEHVALTLFIMPEHFSSEACERFQQRFEREAGKLQGLKHLHILPVYAYGIYQGYPYMLTPYMMHGSLVDVIKRKERPAYTDVARILGQVVAGLSYAHRRNIVHGALKPANIVQSAQETMQVAGFGLMHIQQMYGIEEHKHPFAHLLSVAGTFITPPAYLAPEVLRGEKVDVRSDIYALGVILFELLCGCVPFSGKKPAEVLQQMQQEPLSSLRGLCPDMPIALELVVKQALEQEPQRRFAQVEELAEAFSQVARGLGKSARPAPYKKPQREDEPLQDERDPWQLLPPIITGKSPALHIFPEPQKSQPPLAAPLVHMLQEEQVARSASVLQPDALVLPQSPRAQKVILPPPDAVASQQYVESEIDLPPDRGTRSGAQRGRPAPRRAASSYEQRAQRPEAQEWEQQLPVLPPLSSGKRADPWLSLAGGDEFEWSPDVRGPQSVKRPLVIPPGAGRQRSGSRVVNRRRVLASLATGGVALAGLAFVLHPTLPGIQAQPAPKTGQGQTATTGTQPQPGSGGAPKPGAGNVVSLPGVNQLPANDALNFTNPVDQKASILVHMTDGTFVAFERACTHVGVSVNYDKGTQMLVCPAHGAVFDPANGGAVVQGPATKPLPKLGVKVNGDGTLVIS
ncbi:hypothetical protein KSD_13550 [Ktedonobacter sp. SOSP1-85]|uniref:protein kinase domain-containing protein n=1 Tax=Ktedonobacter sp. SOSP1-85 TaxID=2778367 RepID=UPI0019151615|nr:protein kinase [Ktedonobacter sp. SOSP1-85]GHO73584.1 hypothetical protein KSD_13550 [Ktedonobacter sp. SOSP1-85]